MNITRKQWDAMSYFDRPDYDICSNCAQEAEGRIVDFGTGPGVAWGRPFCDVNEKWVSACCEAEILNPRGFRVEE